MRRPAFVALVTALYVGWLGARPADARRRPTPPPATPVPTPVPTPTPLSEALRLEHLRGTLETIARNAPGRLGISLYDIDRGTRTSVDGDRMFPLAGLFHVAVAVAAFRLADQRKLDLDARVLVTAADLRRGSSAIADAHPRGNAFYALWQLIRAAVVDGDDTACDYVLRAAGGPPAVARLMERLGIHGLAIRKSEADRAADTRAGRTFARGGDNGGTPDAVADLLAAIATQRALLLDTTNQLMLDLGAVRDGPGRFRAGLPSSARLAHATAASRTIGATTDATNDAGILTLPDGRRVVIVALLATSDADAATRDAVLADVARTVYAAYVP